MAISKFKLTMAAIGGALNPFGSAAESIADYLLDGCTVLLNLEAVEKSEVLRMLDFLNGVTYTTGGEINLVSQNTYVITPNDVDVSEEEY